MENLFRFLIFSLPFNAFIGPSVMGELQNDLAIYPILLMAMVLLVQVVQQRRKLVIPSYLTKFLLVIGGLIFCGFIANAIDISSDYMRGRSAFNKFFTSSILLVFVWMTAVLAANVITQREQIETMFIRPFFWGVVAACLFAVPEVLTWYAPALQGIFKMVSYTYNPAGTASIVPSRLHAMSFEPPFFSTYIAFVIPWMLCGYRLARDAGQKVVASRYGMGLALALVLLLLSNSRTGFLIVGIWVLNEILLKLVFCGNKHNTHGAAKVLVWFYGFVFLVLFFAPILLEERLVSVILQGESVSNISRYASTLSAFNMMMDNWFLGVGFGQYAFNALHYMPFWGFDSYEIEKWFFDDTSVWPPVFNLFARLGAELGFTGLLAWMGFWLWILSTTLRKSAEEARLSGKIPAIGFAIIASVLHMFINGLTMDTLRLLGIWIVLGWVGVYWYQKEFRHDKNIA